MIEISQNVFGFICLGFGFVAGSIGTFLLGVAYSSKNSKK